MACASQAMISANTCIVTSPKSFNKVVNKRNFNLFITRASPDDSDCNVEECAPEKEVGKVSMEWLAEEKTKVVGTYPPRNRRGWTGYVEKDTAGQKNIYSVEPVVYVAESAISSGADNTTAIAAGLALIFVAGVSTLLLQVGKSPPQMQTVEYNGPSLSYYINKFKPPGIIEAAVPSKTEPPTPVQAESSAPGFPQIPV